MENSISGVIIKNTVYNAIGRFWGIAVSLILTPYIIANIGIERYGLWAFVGVLTGYFSLLDFGVGISFVKYISEYHARKDYKSINGLVCTGVFFYSALAALAIPLSFLLMDPLLAFFKIGGETYAEAFFVLQLGVILFFVSGAMSAFQSIQGGFQRMDVSNWISIAVSIPMIAGTVYVLGHGYGLRGLMINNGIVLAVSSILNVVYGFRIFPQLELSPRLVSAEMFKKLFNFGYKLQFARAADLLVFQADRLLIAFFLNVGAVGLYQLGSTVAQQMRQIPLLLVSAVLPAASDMDARRESAKLEELYLRGSKFLVLVGVPVVFFTIGSAHLIMLVWMGPGYEKAAYVVQILACGYLVNLLAGVGTSVGAAINKPDFQMGAAIVSAITNIALSLTLIPLLGFLGAALASTISLALGPIYFFIRLHARLRLSTGKIIREIVLMPLFAAAVPAAVVWALNSTGHTGDITSGRLAGLRLLTVEGLAFLSVYLAIVLKAGLLDEYDRGLLKRIYGQLLINRWWKRC